MAKSLTKAALRERRIFNSHGFCVAGGGKVLISAGEHHTALVKGLNFYTDPDAAWYHDGCKCFWGDGPFFRNWRERAASAIQKAQSWASEQYSIREWKRDPFGGWQDARVYDAVMSAKARDGK